MGHGVRYAVPDSKLSDKMHWPIIPLKVATGQAPLLESQHLIILVLARDVCKPGLQGGACTNISDTLVLLVTTLLGTASLVMKHSCKGHRQTPVHKAAVFPNQMPVCHPHKHKGVPDAQLAN